MLVFSSDGFLVRANPAARELLGVVFDTYARRRYPEVLGPESSLVGLIADCLSGGEARREENLRYDSLNSSNPVAAGNGVPLCLGCHFPGKDFVLSGYPPK